MVQSRSSEVTYCGVIGGNVEQDFRSTPAAHISVAVPHTCYEVSLILDRGKTETKITRLDFII